MQKFIRFEKERPFSEVQKSFMDRLGDKFSDHFVGNPEEVKKGQQRSFYPYLNVSENLKVLPYFHDEECLISLCVSCDARYVDGSIIPPKLKIIGLYLETPWNGGTSPEFWEIPNSIVKWLRFLEKAVLYLRTVFIISEFSLDRKDTPVLIMHNLKTFHERVFESDFY